MQLETSIIWRAVFKKKNTEIQIQNSYTKTQKYRSKYNLFREKEITACYWRQSSEPTEAIDCFLFANWRQETLHTQVPEACGRRAWGWASSFTGWGALVKGRGVEKPDERGQMCAEMEVLVGQRQEAWLWLLGKFHKINEEYHGKAGCPLLLWPRALKGRYTAHSYPVSS